MVESGAVRDSNIKVTCADDANNVMYPMSKRGYKDIAHKEGKVTLCNCTLLPDFK